MTRTPAEVFSPGEFLAEELAARRWSTQDLAQRMGGDVALNQLTVELLIAVREKGCLVGAETARQLGSALGTSAEFWLNLDNAWQNGP